MKPAFPLWTPPCFRIEFVKTSPMPKRLPQWFQTHFLQIDADREHAFKRSFLHSGRGRRELGIVLLLLFVPTLPWYGPQLLAIPESVFAAMPAALQWASLITALLALVVNRLARGHLRVVLTVATMNLVAIIFLTALRVVGSHQGFEIPVAIQATLVVGVGVMAGMTARHNLVFFGTVLLGMTVAELWWVENPSNQVIEIYAIVMISGISLIGALAVEHAARGAWKDQASLAYRANYDDLTGLATRAFFREQIESLLRGARRDERPVALAIVDIDHFKAINDTHGHLVGDEVIRSVAEEIRLLCRRSTDLAARLGGEEYALFLYGADAPDAQRLLTELLDRIRALRFHDTNGRPLSLKTTASCGLVTAPPGMTVTRNGLLLSADSQLYVAKRSGRDRLSWELYKGETISYDR